MADAWIAALFGLVGAIIGALASVGAVVWLDKSKEKRDAARAKRLISGELLQAHLLLTSLIEFGLWTSPVDMAMMFPVSAWQEYGANLQGISDEVREEAVTVYTLLLGTRASLAFLDTHQTSRVLLPDSIASLGDTDSRIVGLLKALAD